MVNLVFKKKKKKKKKGNFFFLHIQKKKKNMTHQTKFTAAIPAVGVSTSGTLTVPILPTKANELEKANEGSPLPEHRFSERQKQHAMRRRTCAHNAWDNVRVSKGLMTLRCRECPEAVESWCGAGLGWPEVFRFWGWGRVCWGRFMQQASHSPQKTFPRGQGQAARLLGATTGEGQQNHEGCASKSPENRNTACHWRISPHQPPQPTCFVQLHFFVLLVITSFAGSYTWRVVHPQPIRMGIRDKLFFFFFFFFLNSDLLI